MAGALGTDPINRLEENHQCTVCLEPLKDPRTLPCFHSFCKDCLENVVKTCRDKAPRGRPVREIPCPNCREMFTLDPDKNVADMRRNHFICNMVKATAVLDRGTGVPCSHNCSQSYSVARCVTCEKFLCKQCLTDHNKYRANTDHSVLTMEELSKPENRKKIKDKMCCNEHGKTLKIYCETCDQLICRDCMDFKHVKQNHSCVLVKEVAKNYKELLTSKSKAMGNVLTEGNDIVQRLTRTTERLDRDAKDVKTKIVQRNELMAKKVVEMLNENTKILLNKVDQIHKRERANLDKQTRETKSYVQNVQRSVQLSNKLVDQGTDEEILSSQKMMLESADNLLKKRQECFKQPPKPVAKLRYTARTSKEPLNEDISRMLANSLGDVSSGKDEDKEPVNGKRARGRGVHKESTRANTQQSQDDVDQKKRADRKANSSDEKCGICLCDFTDKKTLNKCGHSFCGACIHRAFQYGKKCPVCGQAFGILVRNQPPGKMTDTANQTRLPGYGSCGTIVINYIFNGGVQGLEHPNPGQRYPGTQRCAFLPDNQEGRKVLRLLRKAFDQKLMFTIGRSKTSGMDNVIIWNGIHHKTNTSGGPTNYGYPDPDYLKRVQEDLTAKGISEHGWSNIQCNDSFPRKDLV